MYFQKVQVELVFKTLMKNHLLRRRRLCKFILLGFGASKIILCSSSARKTFSVVDGPFVVRHFSVSPDSALGISEVAPLYAISLLTPLCAIELRFALCRTHLPWRPTSCPRASDVWLPPTTAQKTHCTCGNGSHGRPRATAACGCAYHARLRADLVTDFARVLLAAFASDRLFNKE